MRPRCGFAWLGAGAVALVFWGSGCATGHDRYEPFPRRLETQTQRQLVEPSWRPEPIQYETHQPIDPTTGLTVVQSDALRLGYPVTGHGR